MLNNKLTGYNATSGKGFTENEKKIIEFYYKKMGLSHTGDENELHIEKMISKFKTRTLSNDDVAGYIKSIDLNNNSHLDNFKKLVLKNTFLFYTSKKIVELGADDIGIVNSLIQKKYGANHPMLEENHNSNNFSCVLPNHNDEQPSMTYYKNSYNKFFCHGCGEVVRGCIELLAASKSGNSVEEVSKKPNLIVDAMIDVLKISNGLSDNIDLNKMQEMRQEKSAKLEKKKELNEKVLSGFVKYFWKDFNTFRQSDGYKYLKYSRGLDPKFAHKFYSMHVGIMKGEELISNLKKNFTSEQLEDSGLIRVERSFSVEKLFEGEVDIRKKARITVPSNSIFFPLTYGEKLTNLYIRKTVIYDIKDFNINYDNNFNGIKEQLKKGDYSLLKSLSKECIDNLIEKNKKAFEMILIMYFRKRPYEATLAEKKSIIVFHLLQKNFRSEESEKKVREFLARLDKSFEDIKIRFPLKHLYLPIEGLPKGIFNEKGLRMVFENNITQEFFEKDYETFIPDLHNEDKVLSELYNLARKPNTIIVAEGVLKALAVMEVTKTNNVAAIGGLGYRQLFDLITEYGGGKKFNIVFALDNDDAAINAFEKIKKKTSNIDEYKEISLTQIIPPKSYKGNKIKDWDDLIKEIKINRGIIPK